MSPHELALPEVLSQLGYGCGDVQLQPIHGGQSGGQVFRLRGRQDHTLVLKLLEPARIPSHLRQDYPQMADAEWRFYTELGPKLAIPLPKIYGSGRLPDGCSFVLMDDLSQRCRIPSEDHRWEDHELRAVLSTYAMLHGRSMTLFASEAIPTWLHTDDRRRFSPSNVVACLQAFYDNAWTREAVRAILHSPALEWALEQVGNGLDSIAPAVLFSDFYPPNVALPLDGSPAILFDWQLVGTGPLQLDIVNIGLLGGQGNFALVDKGALLDFYLDRLAGETGIRYETGEFVRQVHLATLLAWGVFMPRMVRAMQRANERGERFSPSMERTFSACMQDWTAAVLASRSPV